MYGVTGRGRVACWNVCDKCFSLLGCQIDDANILDVRTTAGHVLALKDVSNKFVVRVSALCVILDHGKTTPRPADDIGAWYCSRSP